MHIQKTKHIRNSKPFKIDLPSFTASFDDLAFLSTYMLKRMDDKLDTSSDAIVCREIANKFSNLKCIKVPFYVASSGVAVNERTVLAITDNSDYLVDPMSFKLDSDGNVICGTVSPWIYKRTRCITDESVVFVSYQGNPASMSKIQPLLGLIRDMSMLSANYDLRAIVL